MIASRIAIIVLVISTTQLCASLKTDPYVHTTSGAVRGTRLRVLDKDVDAFLAIPYATPPVGDLRYTKPKGIDPWDGIYDATKAATPCIQNVRIYGPWAPTKDTTLSEDCLYLNVWVPRTDEKKKAVMVWIHGGGFTLGSSSLDIYDGRALAVYGDVIVASMNYRLGSFGFLNAELEEAPGNMGLLDQVLALRWIKDNVKNFGGDPEMITIFGESAGGMSVGLHLLSPMSRGLFTRAIMQSGSPYQTIWGGESSCAGPVKVDTLAKAVGCSDDRQSFISHPQEVLSCLKGKDPLLLAKAEHVFEIENVVYFVPHYGDQFMPAGPIAAVREGNFNNKNPIQLLSGVTSNEGLLFIGMANPEMFVTGNLPHLSLKDSEAILEKALKIKSKSTIEEIAKLYFKGIDETDQKRLIKALSTALGDMSLLCPTSLLSEAASKSGNSVYFYYLDHHPSNSPFKPWTGMHHFDDVQFVFGLPLRYPASYTEEEQEFSQTLMGVWTSFAKTGKPEYSKDATWPEFKADHAYVVLKAREQKVEYGIHLDKCNFWDKHL